ncbi:hypothetical protein [Methanobrevibacter millerae]|nr:hypothetical protein [Methanobrevibacter millerae]
MSYRDRYVEYHSLEWDIFHSPCGECEHLGNCKHYTSEGCPNQEE